MPAPEPGSLSVRFRVIPVLRESLSVFGRHWGLFLALAAAGMVLRMLWVVLMNRLRVDLDWNYEGWFAYSMVVSALDGFVRTLFSFVADALVIVAAYRVLKGQSVSLFGSFRAFSRRLRPVLNAALAYSLLRTLVEQAVWFPYDWIPQEWVLSNVDWLFHLLLFGLVVHLLMSPFWVVNVAAAVEGPQAVRRSWRLTRGNRLRVFVIVMLIFAAWLLTLRVTIAITGGWSPIAARSFGLGREILFLAVKAVVATVGYHTLRLDKDGVGEEQLNEVFN